MCIELMATECTQETVLCFLKEKGGRVKNADLINHFRSFISTAPERKAAVKEAFKSYVDSVAVVKVENGEKYVCLRKRFRGSVKPEDGHHGPDTRHSAAVIYDNSTDQCSVPVKPSHALSTTVRSENKDAEQKIPPDSVCASARAHTPPTISQTSLEGACTSSTHKSKDNAVIRNQHAMNSDTGNHNLLATDESESIQLLCFPTHNEAPSEGRADLSHTDRSEGEPALEAGKEGTAGGGGGGGGGGSGTRFTDGSVSCDSAADDFASDTPKGSRKSFIAHMMNTSPQVRRSMVLRQSRHAATNDGDSSSVHSGHAEEESTAVTLDPLEHEWMMCACDGEWDSMCRLLDREPSLVSKRDFVTGFTCIHWAAKLGKHELLARIVNFARQHGMALDINARSSAGYTPLHLAAMHNHIEVIKLLVGACDADVETRDYSGKKASQYLRKDVARDVLDIAGADGTCESGSEELAFGDEAAKWKLPRVFQTNLRLLHRRASEDDDCVGGLVRDMPLRRKSSLNKLKPRLSKVRAGITPIVRSTSHVEGLEGATGQSSGSFITRPMSNMFG